MAATVHELSAQDARRIAVRAQLLSLPGPTGLLAAVEHLGVVQADQTDAVAPSAELVAWTRLGDRYRRGALDAAIANGSLVELRGFIRPAADVALFRAEMEQWRHVDELDGWRRHTAGWVDANDGARRDVLEALRRDGPLPARDLPDTTVVAWRSSGWNNRRNVRMLLEVMELRGEVAAAGRDGRERQWDLAERIYPDVPAVPLADARRIRNERRLSALGVARERAAETPNEPNDVGSVGEPAMVEGVRGKWRVDRRYLDDDFEPRVALLSPLDRLVFDRKRMAELFAFDYQLEMYKPAARRRWGYWALPVLSGDELVGKVDATADSTEGVLFVDAVHEDGPWSPTVRTAVEAELAALGDWLGLGIQRL